MNEKSVPGLRIFLYTVIDLISHGESKTCTYIEAQLCNGIAKKMYELYSCAFDQNNFNKDCIPEVDKFYKKMSGLADGQEMRKYGCEANDGLALLIKLALNYIC